MAREASRPYHRRFAALYRQIERRHLAAARMQALHAVRLQRWAEGADGQGALRPVFMAAVATTLGMDSVAVTVFGQQHTQAMVATSNATARAAHDLEFVLGEGPTTDASASGRPLTATGSALLDRWPHYGVAVAELGVQAVVATPLTLPSVCLGVLCAFDSHTLLHDDVADSVDRVADALTHSVLLTTETPTDDEDGIPDLPLFTEADYRAVVHQAAGMVSVQCECAIDDALVMIRARAFTDGTPVDTIAGLIVAGSLRLC
ncbi:MAG TPA: GAF domain-containing protein [Pseudonocardiaceae bacterium]|jgi:hypothetical protein|nr:GAF domain-containing protein [Pseudonocardiaceae bacterium]